MKLLMMENHIIRRRKMCEFCNETVRLPECINYIAFKLKKIEGGNKK